MVLPTVGSVILVPFPFSDLSQTKLRPALVVAKASHEDWILCQITSNSYSDPFAIEIINQDFREGALRNTSYVRPGKIFTAHSSLIVSKVGSLKLESLTLIVDAIVGILQEGLAD